MLVDRQVDRLTLTGLAEGTLQSLENLPLFWLFIFPPLLLVFVSLTVDELLDGLVGLGHAQVACCASQSLTKFVTKQIKSLSRPFSETLLGCFFVAPCFVLSSCGKRGVRTVGRRMQVQVGEQRW